MAIADLSIIKSASIDPVGVGQQFDYTITVRNNGPDLASEIIAEDTIPGGLSIIGITVAQGSYCYSNSNIQWLVGSLGQDNSANMTVSVIPLSEGTITNTATIYSNNPNEADPVPNNNTATLEVTVSPAADLLILKESCPTDSFVGISYNYKITAVNNGPSTATAVDVTDTVPSGLNDVTISTSQGSYEYDGTTIVCHFGSLAMNAQATALIQVTPTQTGAIINTCEVTSEVADPNPDNNTASVSTVVLPAADLEITKEASEESIVIGHTLIYTITVTNNGPSQATNVAVTDTLPMNVTVISVNESQGSHTQSGNIINFALGNLAYNASCTMSINIKPTEEGMIYNKAVVSATEEDTNKCNNSASVCTYVKKVAGTDLSVIKTHDHNPALLCAPIQYTITVSNNGPASATGITLVDQIPAAFEVTSIQTSQGRCCSCNDQECHEKKGFNHYHGSLKNCHYGCNDKKTWWHQERHVEHGNKCHGSNELICQLGSLTVGASAVIKITGSPIIPGNLINTAIVTSNEEELDPSNNQVSDTITVITVHQQIEILKAEIEALAAADLLEPPYAQILTQHLRRADAAYDYHNFEGYEKELSEFIDKVNVYMKKGYLPENPGLEWMNKAELMKKYGSCCGKSAGCKS